MSQLSLLDREDCPAFGTPPPAPFVAGSSTSREAAERIAPAVNRLQLVVLRAIEAAGEAGLTDEQICEATGLNPSTERPRRVELERSGLVRDSEARRPTVSGRSAAVWVATPAGLVVLTDAGL